jgi:hypothetical protein
MSLEEKRWWSYAAIALVVPAIYFAIVLPQIGGTPVEEIEFQVPLLIAGGAGALLGVIANIVLRIASDIRSTRGAARIDQRDRDINRLGEYVAGIVLAVAMGVPFVLAMLEVDHFWIAHAMYLAFVLWALAGSAVKLVTYRRGF